MRRGKNSFIIIFVLLSILLVTPVSAHETTIFSESNSSTEIQPLSYTGYYYWAQVGITLKERSRSIGSWRKILEPFEQYQPGYNSITVNQAQRGTISVGISVGNVVAGSISYTPGSTQRWTVTSTSGLLERGYYQRYILNKENVYTVRQQRYWHQYNQSTPVGNVVVGEQGIPTDPVFAWVKDISGGGGGGSSPIFPTPNSIGLETH